MKLVSVIIPTYNRHDSLLRLLDSLTNQTLAIESFEVIVIDDGSTNDPLAIYEKQYPFELDYYRQENQGATIARNNGAYRSRGDILVFIDDDVTISPNALQALADECNNDVKKIALGSLVSRIESPDSIFSKLSISTSNGYPNQFSTESKYTKFVECNTQVLAIRRKYFFELGMLQDPTGGWPNWDDVDFGYRAHNAGFQFIRVSEAQGEHWDHSLASLENNCNRWYNASQSAVRLFQKYPGLKSNLPMFDDKSPINWHLDSPKLIIRKFARSAISKKPMLTGLKRIIRLFEKFFPKPGILRAGYRWISGCYMYKGYRAGLTKYGNVPGPGII
jgi:glycosyltransferase involved in cell wall biosynthesis